MLNNFIVNSFLVFFSQHRNTLSMQCLNKTYKKINSVLVYHQQQRCSIENYINLSLKIYKILENFKVFLSASLPFAEEPNF